MEAALNNFLISRLSFTEIFWDIVFSNGAAIIDQAKRNILSKHLEFEV